eukprot:gnl/MRDRNA2_/MRDRNA2_136528_c0_seq1.p1 gnl/MRDRNA2_/MRDRNA2_136528_c0~~gnl/MRDRNA2_/MRDRNA2_136528_c0_seq1.p1  ORF type:complete len:444 (+),score=63.89 gnl/MRDRNA2_/MRDRNA2_136528_c0_seq1:147-1478(+)
MHGLGALWSVFLWQGITPAIQPENQVPGSSIPNPPKSVSDSRSPFREVSLDPFPRVILHNDFIATKDINTLKSYFRKSPDSHKSIHDSQMTQEQIQLNPHVEGEQLPNVAVQRVIGRIERRIENITGISGMPFHTVDAQAALKVDHPMILRRLNVEGISKNLSSVRPLSTKIHCDATGKYYFRRWTAWAPLNDAPKQDPLAGAMVFPCLLPSTSKISEQAQRRRFCEEEWRKGPRRIDTLVDTRDSLVHRFGSGRIWQLWKDICNGKAQGLTIFAIAGQAAVFEVTAGPPTYDLHILSVHGVCGIMTGERWSLQRFVVLPMTQRIQVETVEQRWAAMWNLTYDKKKKSAKTSIKGKHQKVLVNFLNSGPSRTVHLFTIGANDEDVARGVLQPGERGKWNTHLGEVWRIRDGPRPTDYLVSQKKMTNEVQQYYMVRDVNKGVEL